MLSLGMVDFICKRLFSILQSFPITLQSFLSISGLFHSILHTFLILLHHFVTFCGVLRLFLTIFWPLTISVILQLFLTVLWYFSTFLSFLVILQPFVEFHAISQSFLTVSLHSVLFSGHFLPFCCRMLHDYNHTEISDNRV